MRHIRTIGDSLFGQFDIHLNVFFPVDKHQINIQLIIEQTCHAIFSQEYEQKINFSYHVSWVFYHYFTISMLFKACFISFSKFYFAIFMINQHKLSNELTCAETLQEKLFHLTVFGNINIWLWVKSIFNNEMIITITQSLYF